MVMPWVAQKSSKSATESGLLGRLFREFAVVLSAAIAVSLVVSLTVTPMMCTRLLRGSEDTRPPGFLARRADAIFCWIQKFYADTLSVALRHRWIMLVLLTGIVGFTFYLYASIPKGFFPQQDTGMLYGGISGDQNISFQAMRFIEVSTFQCNGIKKAQAIICTQP